MYLYNSKRGGGEGGGWGKILEVGYYICEAKIRYVACTVISYLMIWSSLYQYSIQNET